MGADHHCVKLKIFVLLLLTGANHICTGFKVIFPQTNLSNHLDLHLIFLLEKCETRFIYIHRNTAALKGNWEVIYLQTMNSKGQRHEPCRTAHVTSLIKLTLQDCCLLFRHEAKQNFQSSMP